MKKETLEHFIYRHHTKQTAKTYLYHINVFLMKQPNAKRLQYNDMVGYFADLRTGKSNFYVLKPHTAAIKRYYDYLNLTGERSDHPCKSINPKQKKKSIQVQDLFSPAELETLMKRENRYTHLEFRNKVIISLLIYQALTCSELCRLKLDDIDLDNGTVTIKGSKKNDARVLELKASQIFLISKYIDISRKKLLKSNTESLLITQRGVAETVEGINSIIEPLKYQYPERNLNPTTIRQSVISNWLNVNKYSLEDVQLLSGHKWISTTENYRRKDINDQLKKINKWHPLR